MFLRKGLSPAVAGFSNTVSLTISFLTPLTRRRLSSRSRDTFIATPAGYHAIKV